MFSSLPRSLLRKAPSAVALAGGATFAAIQPFQQPFQQPVHCNTAVRQSKGEVSVSVGVQFLKLYFKECAGSDGTISLHKDMKFDQAKHMLEAAGAKPKVCQQLLDLMDTNSSGGVDFCEIVVYFLEHGKGSVQEKGSLLFHACDIDSSGKIVGQELKDIIHHMMLLKREEEGIQVFTGGQKHLYRDIPATYVLHYQANEMVSDILGSAGKDEMITEKQFQQWLHRGGKQVNNLIALFN